MISCIVPDCDFTAKDKNPERAKRGVIDHINHDHSDAHVICACEHDWQEVERFVATTQDGTTGTVIELPQLRSKCVRCDQEQIEAVESAGVQDGGEAADEVTVSE